MRTRWIVAAGLAAIGLVWIAQGLGLLAGSGFMDDDRRWALAGLVLLATGVALGWRAFRSRSRT
jgi:hypothetical protein